MRSVAKEISTVVPHINAIAWPLDPSISSSHRHRHRHPPFASSSSSHHRKTPKIKKGSIRQCPRQCRPNREVTVPPPHRRIPRYHRRPHEQPTHATTKVTTTRGMADDDHDPMFDGSFFFEDVPARVKVLPPLPHYVPLDCSDDWFMKEGAVLAAASIPQQDLQFFQASRLLHRGEYRALFGLARAVLENPTGATLTRSRDWLDFAARAAMHLGERESALHFAEQRVSTDTQFDATGSRLLGSVCTRFGDFRGALKAWQHCARVQPSVPAFWCSLAHCYDQLAGQFFHGYATLSLLRAAHLTAESAATSRGFVRDFHVAEAVRIRRLLDERSPLYSPSLGDQVVEEASWEKALSEGFVTAFTLVQDELCKAVLRRGDVPEEDTFTKRCFLEASLCIRDDSELPDAPKD